MPRRSCKFRPEYTEKWSFITRAKDPHQAFCELCTSTFNIKNGGMADVRQHMTTAKHKKNIIASDYEECNTIAHFLIKNSIESQLENDKGLYTKFWMFSDSRVRFVFPPVLGCR